MASEKVLGIGIPSYNGEPYLDRCIPTFLNPEIMDKIEVIIVNDGSKDRTKEIAEKYHKMYPDTVKVINKENGGHGSAVNSALEYTSAKYYKVVDCDDWVDSKQLAKLVEFLETTDADLVSNNYETVDMVTGVTNLIANPAIEYGKEYKFDEIDFNKVYMSIHSTTYKTELLRKNNIRLQEHTFFVDVEYQLLPVPFINTIVFLDNVVYKYMVGNVNQSVDKNNFVRRYDHHNRVVCRILEFLKTAKMTHAQEKYVENIFTKVLYTHYSLSCYYDSDKVRGKQRAKEFDAYLKENNTYYYEKMGTLYNDISRLRKNGFCIEDNEKNVSKARLIKRILFN